MSIGTTKQTTWSRATALLLTFGAVLLGLLTGTSSASAAG